MQQCTEKGSLKDVAGLLHELPEIPRFYAVRQQLIRRGCSLLDRTTIQSAPLAEVAMAVCVLSSNKSMTLSGEQLAWFVQRLVRSEVSPGGPYISEKGMLPQSIDNAWIYGALATLEVPLHSLESFLLQLPREQLIDELLKSGTGCMAIDVLPSRVRAQFLRMIDLRLKKTTHSAEDMVLFARLKRAGVAAPVGIRLPAGATKYFSPLNLLRFTSLQYASDFLGRTEQQKDAVYACVQRFIHTQPHHFQPLLQQLLAAVRARDVVGEIALLPFMTVQSFAKSHQLNAKQLANLGAANITCWMSYTVYDDFLDNEGDPLFLSAANCAHRASLLFAAQAQIDTTRYQAFFDAMDSANTWEQQHARFSITETTITCKTLPVYADMGVLADRAGGHIAGACLVAEQLLASSEYITFEQALRHYLIAKQYNDDIHDWKQDLMAGRITPVVAMILSDAGLTHGTHHFDLLLPRAEEVFYRTTFARVIVQMQLECQRALSLLHTIPSYVPQAGIGQRIAAIVRSSEESLHIQKSQVEFARAFSVK